MRHWHSGKQVNMSNVVYYMRHRHSGTQINMSVLRQIIYAIGTKINISELSVPVCSSVPKNHILVFNCIRTSEHRNIKQI